MGAKALAHVPGSSEPFTFESLPVTVRMAVNPLAHITYLHHDFAGSVIGATDINGAVLWKEDYKPYGERVQNDPLAAGNRQFFTGKPLDADTGLSYMGARYYDPAMGRFMGVDPVDFKEDNLHSFNRYAYANNNPYKFVDPDGRQAVGAYFPNMEAEFKTFQDGLVSAYTQVALMAAGEGIFAARGEGAMALRAGNMVAAKVAAVDAANAGQVAGRTSGTAAGFAKGEQVVGAQSGAPGTNHPIVQKALDRVVNKSDFHGQCAEIGCLNQVYNAGGNASGGSMAAARIRAPGKAAHATKKEACSTCSDVMNQLKVDH